MSRPSRKFKLGSITIDAQAYGSQGNAILGIRDSGKTYTATEIAEKLFDAGIPFITFDPTGVWRWLRVPGKGRGGRGYPVVVAGGKSGDLPLTVSGAVEIVRAAMKNGVSLVIDLTDQNLSKADWKRIVKSCVRVLLQENASHGLRHIFIEEAAEFVPQRVLDGDVYAEVEKLARIGGNSRLGYTLINQRSQEVNKAVLELCENLFLHRQKGKNAIQSLDHWLDVAGVDKTEIVKSLPRLPSGDCWAWMGGDEKPTLIHVPPKNSFHPDRRTMHGAKGKRARKAVNVGSFVKDMRTALVSFEAEFAAKDPVKLTAKIAELTATIMNLTRAAETAKPAKPTKDVIAAAEQRGFEQAKKKLTGGLARELQARSVKLIGELRTDTIALTAKLDQELKGVKSAKPTLADAAQWTPSPAPAAQSAAPMKKMAALKPRQESPSSVTNGDVSISATMLETLGALAWWAALGINTPTRKQLGAMISVAPGGSTMRARLAAVSKAGLVEYPSSSTICLTEAGNDAAPTADTGAGLIETIRKSLTQTELETFDSIPPPPHPISRQELGEKINVEPSGSTMRARLAALSNCELIHYPGGMVARQEWVTEDLSR